MADGCGRSRLYHLDNFDGSGSAFLDAWDQDISITLCWPHIAMNCLPKNRDKFFHSNFYDEAKCGLECVHLARSKDQECLLRELLLIYWRSQNVSVLADHIEDTLHKFQRFYSVNASRVPNHDPSNQAEESSHRTDKRNYFGASCEFIRFCTYALECNFIAY
jgi:hypothetical protein